MPPSPLATAVLSVLPALRCECWWDNTHTFEYVVDEPCPLCVLRAALRAEGVDLDGPAVA